MAPEEKLCQDSWCADRKGRNANDRFVWWQWLNWECLELPVHPGPQKPVLPLPLLPQKITRLNCYREASPCPFPATYSLPLSPVLLSHNLPSSLHSIRPILHSPLSILPPFSTPLATNEMLSRQSSFPPLRHHCPMPLLSMLGSLGCHVLATHAHTVAYYASCAGLQLHKAKGRGGHEEIILPLPI